MIKKAEILAFSHTSKFMSISTLHVHQITYTYVYTAVENLNKMHLEDNNSFTTLSIAQNYIKSLL